MKQKSPPLDNETTQQIGRKTHSPYMVDPLIEYGVLLASLDRPNRGLMTPNVLKLRVETLV